MTSIQSLKSQLTIWDVTTKISYPLENKSRPTCPFCGSTSGFAIRNERYFHCYRCGEKGSQIDLVMKLKDISFSEAVDLLSEEKQSFTRKESTPLEIVFQKSKEWLTQSDKALSYIEKRGWVRDLPIGYIPDHPSPLLEEGVVTRDTLQKLGLLSRRGEFFRDRLIFSIKDSYGQTQHLQGRDLSGESELRWLSTKGEPSVNEYLFNGNLLETFLEESPFCFICEGGSDTLSLRTLGVPAVGILGNYMPLKGYQSKLSQFESLCFFLDNDFYPYGEENEGKYKSWTRMLPEIIKFQEKLPETDIWCLNPPNMSGVKDCNDFLKRINYDSEQFWEYVEGNVKPLDQMALEVFDHSDQDLYWLVKSTIKSESESRKKKVKERIQSRYPDWLDFLKIVL